MVIKKFTFAISSPDEFLLVNVTVDIVSRAVSHLVSTSGVCPVNLNPTVMHFSQCQ